MNYAELCTAVADEMENTFETDDLARFARQTEQKVYQAVNLPVMRANQTGAVTASNQYLSAPAGFLYPYSLAVIGVDGSYSFLLNKDVNYIREMFPYPGTSGVPKAYAVFDSNTFILGPTPDSNYQVEIHFAAYPASIVDAGTSWLGDNYDVVLFAGMCLEAAMFMKQMPDDIKLREKAFADALTQLKQLADGKLRQDAYRSGQTRVPT